ncbi:mechanosensitive ion channel family protein [Xylophilus sp.]|uniref:mechanosensitive ion channel family protein n=1 Tax=Xylophilus sp. TaxID=2653893 RepID=UPI0013B6DC60|nr:MAG: hypothetical protein GAK38_01956 [Xylophilus sp.]
MNEFGFRLEPLRAILYQTGAFIPRLLMAALVVLVGWLVAKVARFAVTRALRAVNFPVLTGRAGLDGFLRQGGVQADTTGVVGALVYWVVILAALIIAFNGLGLNYITDLLGKVVWFVPNIFVALLILAFGAYFARFVGDAVYTYSSNAGLRDARFFSRVAQYAILVFVVLIALDQVRIGGDIVRQSFIVILAGFVFALALAFGLAGRDWAARRIDEWLPRDGPAAEPAPPLPAAAAPDPAAAADPPAPIAPPAAQPFTPETEVPHQDDTPAPAGTRRPPGEPLIPRRPIDPPPPI